MAMNIISKEKKEIRWIGLPTNSAQECQNIEVCHFWGHTIPNFKIKLTFSKSTLSITLVETLLGFYL